jgi:hypothetical protein
MLNAEENAIQLSYKPRGTKPSRIAARFRSRTFGYPELRNADSIDRVVNSQDAIAFQGFNANPLRGKIMKGLAQAAGCTVFVETGSGKAATTLAAHSFVDLPVWSCEKSRINYLICRCLTAGLRNVELKHADSLKFLRSSVERLAEQPGQRPFFFLDAHGGIDGTGKTGESCPLVEELEIVLRLPQFVAAIDDVRLEGFVGGTYGKTVIDLPMIAPTLARHGIQEVLLPGYRAGIDIGWPSGYCVFSRGTDLTGNILSQFPLNLLVPRRIVETI